MFVSLDVAAWGSPGGHAGSVSVRAASLWRRAGQPVQRPGLDEGKRRLTGNCGVSQRPHHADADTQRNTGRGKKKNLVSQDSSCVHPLEKSSTVYVLVCLHLCVYVTVCRRQAVWTGARSCWMQCGRCLQGSAACWRAPSTASWTCWTPAMPSSTSISWSADWLNRSEITGWTCILYTSWG